MDNKKPPFKGKVQEDIKLRNKDKIIYINEILFCFCFGEIYYTDYLYCLLI